jgi:hypothetical protein
MAEDEGWSEGVESAEDLEALVPEPVAEEDGEGSQGESHPQQQAQPSGPVPQNLEEATQLLEAERQKWNAAFYRARQDRKALETRFDQLVSVLQQGNQQQQPEPDPEENPAEYILHRQQQELAQHRAQIEQTVAQQQSYADMERYAQYDAIKFQQANPDINLGDVGETIFVELAAQKVDGLRQLAAQGHPAVASLTSDEMDYWAAQLTKADIDQAITNHARNGRSYAASAVAAYQRILEIKGQPVAQNGNGNGNGRYQAQPGLQQIRQSAAKAPRSMPTGGRQGASPDRYRDAKQVFRHGDDDDYAQLVADLAAQTGKSASKLQDELLKELMGPG